MIVDSEMEARLRQGFKQFDRFMLLLWRLGLGGWVNALPSIGGRIMVVSHFGRKTGSIHHTPVNYAIVDGEIFCTAAFGGATDWYRNVLARPGIEVWLPDGWWSGQAEDVSEIANRLPILRQVLINSGFAAYAVGIDPRTTSETELAAATAKYRLIRIHRSSPCTGRGGPGDLAWVWPLATMILIPMALARRKSK